ncbi:hypothetical protein SKAU_G00018340 [Synaphobranchus kaupii]|uniref:Uncharacterized protein n=1 Tax=Synaphobranchus kaupii TaxID=118154 RepID=A0A9Q1JBY6_SYNKA|nr:hypothetical protein SKAU_G00018340 [Synaphobranchus kaupii]
MQPVLQTGYPDLFLSIGRVTLGEKAREGMKHKQKKMEQKECILKAACALLNGGGGIIRMEAENQSYDYITDALGQDVERALGQLVNSTPIHEFFEFNQQGTELLMFVKSWCSSTERASICSISTGLFQRSGTSVDSVSSSVVNHLLQKNRRENHETSKISQFYNRNNVKLNELLDFGEGRTVDFKDFGSEKLITRLKEQVPRYISAFANTVGGFLFIGVNDARRVTGCGRGKNKEELKESVEEICGKSIAVHRRGCSNSRSWSVEHRIIECLAVEDENDTEPRYVLAIKIPAFCCAVFEKHPDSWQIKDSKMCRFMAEPWLRMMERADPGDKLIGCFKKQLSLHDAPPQCKTVYGFQEEHLKRLQEHIFPIGEDDISTGPGTLVESLFGMYENLKNLLTLERRDAPGVLIFSSSWAVDIGRVRNSHVICDALLICRNSPPCLYTVVQEGSKDLWEYATLTAFHLKQKLVNDGGYSQRVCVVPKLVDCKTGTLIPVERKSLDGGVEMVLPDCYNLRRVEIESVLRSLVIVLLSFTSVLSDELGCEFLNLLTEEQFQVLQTFEDIKELFVHGLPGSGKTVLAAEIMKRIKNKYDCKEENILYICENQPLRSSMSKKELCLCFTRKCFMMKSEIYFSEVKHIIVDEGQNFRFEDGDWIQKASCAQSSALAVNVSIPSVLRLTESRSLHFPGSPVFEDRTGVL